MLRLLTGIAVRRGLFGNSRPWLGVLVVTVGLRILGRMAGGKPKVLYQERLKGGDALVIARGTPVAHLSPDGSKMGA